jgi:peptide/nickel transport system permease protein
MSISTNVRPVPVRTPRQAASQAPRWLVAARLKNAAARQPVGFGAAIAFVALMLLILAAPFLPLPDGDVQGLRDRLRPPMSRGADGTLHLAGTDQLGRDVLSRTLSGATVSLGVAAATVIVSGVVGAFIGLVAGYRRGVADILAMRLVDVQMAVPPLLLAIFLLYLIGTSLLNLVLLLSILSWWSYTRIVRAETLRLRNAPFIEAAIVAGCSQWRVLFRHVLPQMIPVLIVITIFDFSSVMLAEAGISFLGFGVQPPNSSWGRMIAEGQTFVTTGAWWLLGLPGLAIFVTVLLARFASTWLQAVVSTTGSDAR